jgi:8-oxo-dGTP diphosphatase
MHTYRGTTADEPTLTEHLAYRWLDPEALKSLDWAEADVPIVTELLKP